MQELTSALFYFHEHQYFLAWNSLSLKLSLGRLKPEFEQFNEKSWKHYVKIVELQPVNQHQQLQHTMGFRSGRGPVERESLLEELRQEILEVSRNLSLWPSAFKKKSWCSFALKKEGKGLFRKKYRLPCENNLSYCLHKEDLIRRWVTGTPSCSMMRRGALKKETCQFGDPVSTPLCRVWRFGVGTGRS